MAQTLWDHIDPVTLTVKCGTHRHRIALGPEGVIAHDHNLEQELVLHALGADTPRCVLLARAWQLPLGAEHLPVIAGDARISTWAIRKGVRRRVRAHSTGQPLDVTEASSLFELADPPQAMRSLLGVRVLLDTTLGRPYAHAAEMIRASAPGEDVHVVCRTGYLFPTLAFGWSDGERTVATVALGRGWESNVRRPGLETVDGHFILHAGPLPAQRDVTYVFALRWERGLGGWFAVPRRARIDDGHLRWGTIGTIRPRL